MRAIKFRAWHPALERMFYNCSVTSPRVIFEGAVSDGDWKNDSGHFGGTHETLMQYTGLKDCKGTDIYEGDVVKHRRKKYEVVWNNVGWGTWGMCDKNRLMCDKIYLGELEAMGNIYENKELLPCDR